MSEIVPVFPWSTVSKGPDAEFGPRPNYPYHNGIDFAIRQGTPVAVPAGGRVTEAGWHYQLGWFVRMVHWDQGGERLGTGYAHMESAPTVSVGQQIPRGHVIGRIGSTGLSSGPHMHHETWRNGTRINPRDWYPLANRVMGGSGASAGSGGGGGGAQPSGDGRQWIDLSNWYWYTSPDQAQAMRNPRKPLLEGRYPVIGRAPNGAVQVLSNSRGRIWVHSSALGGSSAPAPAPAPAPSLLGRELNLTSPWYWYRSAGEARAMRNPQGKGRNQNMLSGRGYIVLAVDGGALQVHSKSMGTVWLHPDARHRVI